jgi:hypothetical protein
MGGASTALERASGLIETLEVFPPLGYSREPFWGLRGYAQSVWALRRVGFRPPAPRGVLVEVAKRRRRLRDVAIAVAGLAP